MPASLFRTIVQSIDLTSLSGDESDTEITALCNKANEGIDSIRCASVCVFPQFAEKVKAQIQNSIRLSVVAPGFPQKAIIDTSRDRSWLAVADEVDAVVDTSIAKSGKWLEYSKEIKMLRLNSKGKILKIIIESGELNAEEIQKATVIVAESGGDFVKTSTGKTSIGYRPEDLRIICSTLKLSFEKRGIRTGVKVSGGIRNFDRAVEAVGIISEKLGNDWLNPLTFRIGASNLYDELKSHAPNHQ